MRAAPAVLLLVSLACRDQKPLPKEKSPEPVVNFLTDAGEVAVAVEVVSDPEARSRGLMHRKSLAPFAGMAFVFPAEAENPFWMKNTLVSLDIIFINNALEVVGIVANAEPLTQTTLSVGKPSRYVVEVNGGFAAKHGIREGTRVVFEDVL